MGKQAKQLRVKCFRNLHFNDRIIWSVQYYNSQSKSWLLMMHTPNVMLRNCRFIVSERGRQKVIDSKRKNVHAFVLGELVVDTNLFHNRNKKSRQGITVTYDPYKYRKFVVAPDSLLSNRFNPLDEIEAAAIVWMKENGKVVCWEPVKSPVLSSIAV